ncbi:TPA: hypothetical protein N0F65_001598 [Lagenidium giganteum]|uniref:IPO4/5-like TPR repeats domain-containing protein n=1 Tax=Lagenidium giganteum TaxID=4803 RepID=A0AAV2Z5J5_9STRA|nr:TPA: hypothetical protein N0F65_001598 [Lagenidium giganteum]
MASTIPSAMTESGAWEKLLWSLMSADNAERNHAEACFAELKEHADQTLVGLVQVVHSPASDDVRGLAAVLLRRVLLRDAVSLWPNANDGVRTLVKAQLLAVLSSERNRSIRRKVCDTVGELASSILDDGQWDELLPTLLQWSQDANVTLRETTLRVLEMIALYLASMLECEDEDLRAHFEVTFLGVLENALADTDGRVAVNAARALAMLLINMESLQLQRQERLTATLPLILQAIHRMLLNQQFDDVMETLEVLIEVIEPHALFVKPCLREYVETMVQIADAATVPDGCRQLAMEFLVSLAEHARAACRKLAKNFFVNAVYPVAFKMMLELQDVDTWSVLTCDDEEDELNGHEISNFDVGSEALERLVDAIGAKKSLAKCFALIHEYAANTDNWVFRHAALVGLCQILEIVPPENLEMVVRHLFNQAYDAHPRVCCTAIDVIGQLAMDQAPQFQELYHKEALAMLLHYLNEFEKPRLQAHAATALRQFIDSCQPHLFEPYLEKLLHQLFLILQRPNHARVVREQAITALSSIATMSGPGFAKYYGSVMPTLKQILLDNLNDIMKWQLAGAFTLGGITLECISLIGVAVGKATFAADAEDVMKIMAEMQNTPRIAGNEWIRTYLLQAWARCCKCLGQDFASYLPIVMPSLLFAATQQAEFEVDPSQLPDEDEAVENDDIQIAQVNDRCLSIRTSVLEEKATACQLLASMVADLEGAFLPYAEQVTQVLAPLMTDSVHSDIRSAAINSMAALVKCVAIAAVSADTIKQMLDFALGRLVNALTSEPELELVMNIMQSMKECITNALGDNTNGVRLNEAQLKELVQGLLVVLGDSMQRRAARRAEKLADDSDSGDEYEDVDEGSEGGEDDLEQLEQHLQFVMADCMGYLAKTHREQFFPVFEALLWEKISEMTAAHCLPEDRKLALYILDDVLEHCGAPAMAQMDVFLPLLLDVLKTSNGYAPVVQAACFGIGVCARFGGDSFAGYAQTCVDLLGEVLNDPQAYDSFQINATDNATSAFGLIGEHHPSAVDAHALFAQWLQLQPLRGDLEESLEVMKRLCRLVHERNEHVLGGPDGQHVGTIVRIFAEFLTNADAYTAEVGEEPFQNTRAIVAQTLTNLRASVPDQAMAHVWAALPAPHQMALHALFG